MARAGFVPQCASTTPPVRALWSASGINTLASVTLPRLYTPEEVAEQLGHLSPYTIRGLVAKGKVPSIRGTHGAVLFTEELVADMLRILTVGPDEAAEDSWAEPEDDEFPFATTGRSRARSRSRNY